MIIRLRKELYKRGLDAGAETIAVHLARCEPAESGPPARGLDDLADLDRAWLRQSTTADTTAVELAWRRWAVGNREAEAAILARTCFAWQSRAIRPLGRGAERKSHGHNSTFASHRCPVERAFGWSTGSTHAPLGPAL